MEEGSGRRKYDKQFKDEAARLVTEGGRQIADVARSLGIHENLLHTWKRKFDESTQIIDNPVIKDLKNFTSDRKGYEYNPRRFIGYLTYRYDGVKYWMQERGNPLPGMGQAR